MNQTSSNVGKGKRVGTIKAYIITRCGVPMELYRTYDVFSDKNFGGPNIESYRKRGEPDLDVVKCTITYELPKKHQ